MQAFSSSSQSDAECELEVIIQVKVWD
ncbi:hypothetical protein EYF80_065445 [Liparis tanakae]|uniref:Uncharacterized protein n=1 Tax=Liparis tanakae TaxID=230148 RepID=A0A4Z2E783_9TELE|nr:hypothetical protein EYF80_065445 [Liparis tanakae]